MSFSGTSNASGTTVYAQKVYDYENLAIGYTFANILITRRTNTSSSSKNLYQTAHGNEVEVDVTALHDVQVQRGGNAEPIELVGQSATSYSGGGGTSAGSTAARYQLTPIE